MRELAFLLSGTICFWILRVSLFCQLYLLSIQCSIELFPFMCADAQPTSSEMETFVEVETVLKKGQEMLKEISQYRGASKEIREVLNDTLKCI